MKKISVFIYILFVLVSLSCMLIPWGQTGGIISTPYDNQTVRGVQTILVTPPEDVLVDDVEFYINDDRIYIDTTDPYSAEWDTFDETNGWYIIYVELNGLQGEFVTNAVRVRVDNQE